MIDNYTSVPAVLPNFPPTSRLLERAALAPGRGGGPGAPAARRGRPERGPAKGSRALRRDAGPGRGVRCGRWSRPPLGGRRRPRCAEGPRRPPRGPRRSHDRYRVRPQARLARAGAAVPACLPAPPAPATGCRSGAGEAAGAPPAPSPARPTPLTPGISFIPPDSCCPIKAQSHPSRGPFIWGSFMTLCKCAKFLIRLARQPQAALAPRSLHASLCFTAQQAALLL